MPVYNSAKAIIISEGKLLLIENDSTHGVGIWYCLPGGRQKDGESLTDALARECKEEIGVSPIVQKLLFVREYIGAHYPVVQDDSAHKVEFMFRCSLEGGNHLRSEQPDRLQRDIVWVALEDLHKYNLMPSKLKALTSLLTVNEDPYWGDVL